MGSRLFALVGICLTLSAPLSLQAAPSTKVNPSELREERRADGPRLVDRGIFPDLDQKVRIGPPPPGPGLEAVAVNGHGVLVVYRDGVPHKAYALLGPAGDRGPLPLRPQDRAELAPLLATARLRVLPRGAAVPGGDRDSDGIPDQLDALLGAHKTALNGARYGAGYMRISFPGGDVPRAVGVCTDVVIRALRNAGP